MKHVFVRFLEDYFEGTKELCVFLSGADAEEFLDDPNRWSDNFRSGVLVQNSFEVPESFKNATDSRNCINDILDALDSDTDIRDLLATAFEAGFRYKERLGPHRY